MAEHGHACDCGHKTVMFDVPDLAHVTIVGTVTVECPCGKVHRLQPHELKPLDRP